MAGSAAGGPPTPVVLVDESASSRRFARTALEADAEFAVVGEARNGREAVALVEQLRPRAVLMDVDALRGGGLDAIEQIMAVQPTAILVRTAVADGDAALAALAAGAVDVVVKPAPDDPRALAAHADCLRVSMRVAARVRVITHPRGRLRASAAAVASPSAVAVPAPRGELGLREVSLLVIGASTGGPQALLTLLSGLPADLEQAVLVVQHMAEAFVPGLAQWLDELVALPVGVGATGQRLLPGTVTVAPGGGNLLVQDDRLRVRCCPPEPGQFHVPGIDATLTSVAEALGPAAIGVVLTGMGRDGSAGLKLMRERGAATLGQDEATSVVYGMPAAAYAAGAVDRQLPLPDIAPAVLEILGRRR